jgi:hypothetical protein
MSSKSSSSRNIPLLNQYPLRRIRRRNELPDYIINTLFRQFVHSKGKKSIA